MKNIKYGKEQIAKSPLLTCGEKDFLPFLEDKKYTIVQVKREIKKIKERVVR